MCKLALFICAMGIFVACSDTSEVSVSDYDMKLSEAIRSLQIFNFDEAYQSLSTVMPFVPDNDPDWPMLAYCLAVSAWHKSPPSQEAMKEAESYFKAVIEKAPESELAASSLLELGRLYEIADFRDDIADLSAARNCYQRVRQDFTRSDMSARAALFLAQTYAQEFERPSVEKAIEVLTNEMAMQPHSPWFGVMAQFASQIYAFYLDDSVAAVSYYGKASEAGFPRPAEADISLWQFGLLAEAAGQEELAADVYGRIVEDYPRSIFGSVARQRVIRIAERNPDSEIRIPELPKISLGR